MARPIAVEWLPVFVASDTWQVRMYAARAAARLDDVSALKRLAADRHASVREAAVSALSERQGHAADAFYLDALNAEDYQLVRTAARALAGTPDRDRAVPALLGTLERLTAARRDTSRDPRMAILSALMDLGSPARAPSLEPYLRDVDPAVATRAAAVLEKWTGRPYAAITTRFAARPAPAWTEVAALDSARARFLMQQGGAFEIRLFAPEAPATVARFVRLARAQYYDGLTFHRVVPNFVIQGGSPGANEYVGDGPYMRDELGLRPHLRGAVGISTRGRDTGDAQIFIDLVDNPRLDHNYTVFGEVTRGLDVVDRIQEGAVIERVEIVGR